MLPAEKKVKRTIQNTSVCSYGGFAYGGRLIKEWGLESLGIIEYDSKEGGAHGGVFGLEIGPVVLGVESLRTWNDWKSHTGPIVIGGGEFSAASKISGKNVKAGTLELGGFANVMGEELSVGGYLGAGIFGGGGYLSVSSTGCKQ